jgi:hypothetical protein
MLWSLYCIQAQGHGVECIGLYQDNISAQLLIKNGRMSSGKETKQIKAKFFFIKDRIDSGEIKVKDCPSEEMWADVLPKPLQLMVFRTVQAELMNCLVNFKDESEQMMREERNETRRGAKEQSTTTSPKIKDGDLKECDGLTLQDTAGVCRA